MNSPFFNLNHPTDFIDTKHPLYGISKNFNVSDFPDFYQELGFQFVYPVFQYGAPAWRCVFLIDDVCLNWTLSRSQYDGRNIFDLVDSILSLMDADKSADLIAKFQYNASRSRPFLVHSLVFFTEEAKKMMIRLSEQFLDVQNIRLDSKSDLLLTFRFDGPTTQNIQVAIPAEFNSIFFSVPNSGEVSPFFELYTHIQAETSLFYPDISFFEFAQVGKREFDEFFSRFIVQRYTQSDAYKLNCLFDKSFRIPKNFSKLL